MDKKHYNELIVLSQRIYDQASGTLNDYISSKYGSNSNDTFEQQLEDYLVITEETSAYFVGNALALLDPESLEAEIKTYVENLRRVVAYAQKKLGSNPLPN